MIEVDGSIGEGGGQVLRTSLTMSVMVGDEFRIYNIRTGRKNPGLRPQHFKAVEAATTICNGIVSGAELGSQELVFKPGDLKPGNYSFAIGTAGSVSLVLQTIFVPLSHSTRSSRIKITGGTHVPWSPSYHYLDYQWLPYLRRLGYEADLNLLKAGFYPKGGGQISVEIKPATAFLPIENKERGKLIHIRGLSGVANLPRKIAERQRNQVIKRLGNKYPLNDLHIGILPSYGKGTILLLLAEFEFSQACFFSLGAIGKPAEKVADEAIDELEDFIATNGVVDGYLADQILIPLVFAKGESIFKTSKITKHLQTNVEVIRHFSRARIQIHGEIGNPGMVEVLNDS